MTKKKAKELIMVALDKFNNKDKLKHTNKFSIILDKIKNRLYKNNWELPIEISQNNSPESQTEIEKHGDFEFEHTIQKYHWVISIKDSNSWQELWKLKYSIQSDSIKIDTIISYQKWAWTKLVQRIIELSKAEWKNWVVTAVANPFLVSSRPSYRKELTNLWFYYKLWFRAKDEKVHQEILKSLDSWEEMLISLNINAELIYNPNLNENS